MKCLLGYIVGRGTARSVSRVVGHWPGSSWADALSVEGLIPWSLILPSRRSRWSLAQRLLVRDPVVLGVVQRVYHLGHELVGLGYLQHRTGILVPAAVVRS